MLMKWNWYVYCPSPTLNWNHCHLFNQLGFHMIECNQMIISERKNNTDTLLSPWSETGIAWYTSWFMSQYWHFGFKLNPSWMFAMVPDWLWIWFSDPGGDAHHRRGGGAVEGPRPVLRAGRRKEEDHADLRPEHRLVFPHQVDLLKLLLCDVEFNLFFCLLLNAQPVWLSLLGNWKASTWPCKHMGLLISLTSCLVS